MWLLVAAIGAVCFALGWQIKGFLVERAEYAAEERRWAVWDAEHGIGNGEVI